MARQRCSMLLLTFFIKDIICSNLYYHNVTVSVDEVFILALFNVDDTVIYSQQINRFWGVTTDPLNM